jgi:hypothetical protein
VEYQKVISSRKYLECKYDENGKEIVINNWSNDVNTILDKIRINSILLSNEHKKSYFLLSAKLKWFRIPMILLSSLGSIFNVGLPPYIGGSSVEILCAIISLSVGLIGSLELFLAIGTKMESELIQSKELYLLAIEIQKTLLLDSLHRNGDGIAYLEDRFNMYSKLIENSQLLECRIIDELTPLPDEYIKKVLPNVNLFYPKQPRSSGSSVVKSPRPRPRFSGIGIFQRKQNAVMPQPQDSFIISTNEHTPEHKPTANKHEELKRDLAGMDHHTKRSHNRNFHLSNHIENTKLDHIEEDDASIVLNEIFIDPMYKFPPSKFHSTKPHRLSLDSGANLTSIRTEIDKRDLKRPPSHIRNSHPQLSPYTQNTPYNEMKNVIIPKDVYSKSIADGEGTP